MYRFLVRSDSSFFLPCILSIAKDCKSSSPVVYPHLSSITSDDSSYDTTIIPRSSGGSLERSWEDRVQAIYSLLFNPHNPLFSSSSLKCGTILTAVGPAGNNGCMVRCHEFDGLIA